MELPQEIDDYIKESIDCSLGLPVSSQTLELKLRASEEACRSLRDQYMYLQMRLKEKDEVIDRVRAESSMNAQALKRFVEENQKLAMECANLLSQRTRLEKECSLYDHDREALMDFGNEAHERAKEAEIKVQELEEELRGAMEELQFYKYQNEMRSDDLSTESATTEQLLLESLITTLIGNDEFSPIALTFLEANSGVEVCQKLLKNWNSLRPSTKKVLGMAAEVRNLQQDKEHLRINLARAEEEVNVLFEENKILDKENKRLIRHQKEKCYPSSSEKHTSSSSGKGSKRKSSPKMSSSGSQMSSPVEKKIDFSDESPRKPLSPLHLNSPDSRMHQVI
ncbi:hypothetical protein NMG60_11016754 [Bertholletia excelsa]